MKINFIPLHWHKLPALPKCIKLHTPTTGRVSRAGFYLIGKFNGNGMPVCSTMPSEKIEGSVTSARMGINEAIVISSQT